MSFGFSVSDITDLIQLTTRTYRGWERTCGEYAEVTHDLKNLNIFLSLVANEVEASTSLLLHYDRNLIYLQYIIFNCWRTVIQLEAIISKDDGIVTSRRDNWNRIRFGQKNLNCIRTKLGIEISTLGTYFDAIGVSAMGPIDNGLNELPDRLKIGMLKVIDCLAGDIRAGRRESFIMTTYEDDEKEVWRQFRRELISEGFSSENLKKTKGHLRKYVTRMAEAGLLDEEVPEESEGNCRGPEDFMVTGQREKPPAIFYPGPELSNLHLQPAVETDDSDTESHDSHDTVKPGNEISYRSYKQSCGSRESGTVEYSDFTVGWICAKKIELAVAIAMLDTHHNSLPRRQEATNDNNIYAFGTIGEHHVVIAGLPSGAYNNVSAAIVANQMVSTFPSLKVRLLVGIGAGVPSQMKDIRLGDIVVGIPGHTDGGIIQYDLGKATSSDVFVRTGSPNWPPDILLNAVTRLEAEHTLQDPVFSTHLQNMGTRWPKLAAETTLPVPESDRLFQYDYPHPNGKADLRYVRCFSTCAPSGSSGRNLCRSLWLDRLWLPSDEGWREARADEKGADILCIEMEAAGLMNTYPCLVIRGICDYADSHKSDVWQGYASVAAAAYAKELLNIIPASVVTKLRPA